MKVKKIPQNFSFEVEMTTEEFTELIQSSKYLMHYYTKEMPDEDWPKLAPAVAFLERIITSRAR